MTTSLSAADAVARRWRSDESGPIRLGSEQQKVLFSRMLLDTFNPYKPGGIDWPQLDAEARNRLISLPIWDIAVATEGKASLNVSTNAASIADPLLRETSNSTASRRAGTRPCWRTWCRPTASRSDPSRFIQCRATPNGPS